MDSYQTLQQEFTKVPLNLPKLGELLKDATLQLTTSGALVMSHEKLSSTQLVVIRDILEMGAYWSIHSQDGHSFERYLAQLAPFYDNPNIQPASPRMCTLIGLYLLNLLVTGHRAQYYTRLAKVTPACRADPRIVFVLEMDQCLMEGTYHRLLLAKNQTPEKEFIWLVEALIETVRYEIADGMEATYEQMNIPDAMSMLLLDPNQASASTEFASKRGWTIQADRIIFPKSGSNQHESEKSIMPKVTIKRALQYAAELEQII